MLVRTLCWFLGWSLASVVMAAERPAVPRVDGHGSVEIDAVLDESVWDDALVIDVGYEVRPAENVPAPVRTDLLLWHDADALYVAFRAFDPKPEEIRAHLWDRDGIGPDDWVVLVLDTFNGERWNYTLQVNPLGVQGDFIEVRNSNSVEWDAIWESAGQVTDWGWAAELRIPFSSLRFQRSDEPQVWGIDAVRSYPRAVRHHLGSFPRDRANACYLCQAIKVEGFAGVKPGRSLELTPTLTTVVSEVREPFPEGSWTDDQEDVEIGITGRWGITPNLTLSGTVNPDFSQVEADALQLDVNQPFALFFDEKRPFFMEGSQLFDTVLDVVYTRTVRDPEWGAKITGREGQHTIGAYVLADDITNLIFPGAEGSRGTSLDLESTVAVARYAYDFDSSLSVGALATSRHGDGYSNRVVGLDGEWRPVPTDRLQWQVLRSSTEYPGATADEFNQPTGEFSDWAGLVKYVHDDRSFDYWGLWYDIGTDFRADLGFIPRVDYRQGTAGASYTWYPSEDDEWFTQLDLLGEVRHRERQNGDLLLDDVELTAIYQGPIQSHSVVELHQQREGYRGQEFDLFKVFLHHCMNPDGHSHIWLNIWLGDQLDYTNVQRGDRIQVEPGVSYGFGRHLRLEAWYLWERLEVGDELLYEASIPQATLSYQFNPRTFLRAILQYVDYSYNVDQYSDGRDPEFQRLFTQLLFSYKLNPQTVLFLGYSDNSFGSHEFNLTRKNRTLFAKFGYAWNL